MLNFKLLPLLAALGLANIKGEFNSCKRPVANFIGIDQAIPEVVAFASRSAKRACVAH